MKSIVRLVVGFLIFLLVGIVSGSTEEIYIEVISDVANIRVLQNTSSTIFTQSIKGDIFELRGKEGEWYQINMFTGEWRYFHDSLAKEI